MQVQIGKHSCAVYVKPDLTFRRVWEDVKVGRSWDAQQYITARLTLKDATTSMHLTTQPLLDRFVRVGDKLVVELMQEASVEISTGVLRIANFFHSHNVEVMLLAIGLAGEDRKRGVFNRGNLADISIALYEGVESWLDDEDAMSEYYEVYVKGNHVEDCTRSWRKIGAPHKPNVLLIRKSSTTAASVTAKASIDTTLQVQDEKKGANEHTHAHGTMSAPSQPDVTNQSVNKGIAVPHKKSGGRNSQPNEAKATGIQSAPSRDTPIALSPSKKIESHAQNRNSQQLSPLSIQHSVVQSVRFAQQLEEIVAPQVTAVKKPRQLLVVKGILQREDFTGLHGVAAIQHRSLRQSNDSKVMLDSNSVEELSLKADVSTTRALGPFNIDRKLNSAAKCDLDGLTTATGQHTIKESAELRKDPQRVGVLLQGEEQTGAWKAHRKAAKQEKHREIQRAKRQCKSQVRLLEKEKARATSQWPHVSERLHKKARTTSQWLIVLKNLEVTKEEWPRIRNHLRSTSPQLFRRIRKGDAIIDCDSLRYEAQNFKPAALPFILVAVRHGMPTQVLIETVRAVRAAIQARVSEMAAARETALAHPVKCDKDQGDIGHASRDGSGKPSSWPGNHKERRFRTSKRLEAQAQADAKIRQAAWLQV